MALYAIVVAAVGAWVCRKRWLGVLVVAAFACYAFGLAFYLYPKISGQGRLPHYAVHLERVKEGGIWTLFEPKEPIPLSTRLWFFVKALGPLAVFLPFAGVGAVMILPPAYSFLTYGHGSIVRHDFGFSSQFLPFAYAAAAFGLARISALRRVKLRTFLPAAGSVAAVVFQLVSIGSSYRQWYAGYARSLYPNYHKIGTLAGARKVPGGIAVSADYSAFNFLTHNRNVATVYPRGLGLGGLEAVDGVFLDRDYHCALALPSDMARLHAAGFYPAELTRDYAYFTRTPGEYSYEDVWDTWCGVISESHFWVNGVRGKPRRDTRAPQDGIVRCLGGNSFLLEKNRYFFPPGNYKFTYIMKCDKDVFCHVCTCLVIRRPCRKGLGRRITESWTLERDGEYHGYVFKLKIMKPSTVVVEMTGTPGYFLDGIAVAGDAYNLRGAGEWCPRPYLPRGGLPDVIK